MILPRSNPRSNEAIFNEDTWQRSASFYRAAVASLLSPGRGLGLTTEFLPQPTDAEWTEICGNKSETPWESSLA